MSRIEPDNDNGTANQMVGGLYLEFWLAIIRVRKGGRDPKMSSWRVFSLCPLCSSVNTRIRWRRSWKRRTHTTDSVCDAKKVVVVHKTSRLEFEQMKRPDLSTREVEYVVSDQLSYSLCFIIFQASFILSSSSVTLVPNILHPLPPPPLHSLYYSYQMVV